MAGRNRRRTGVVASRQPPTSQPPTPAESSERNSAPDQPAGFDVNASVPLVVGDDLDACADPVRHYFALYIGGMGSRDQNFYNQLARRMGFDQAADEIQARYLEKEHRRPQRRCLPTIDQTSLLGTTDRIADRLRAFAEAGVTPLSVTPFAGRTRRPRRGPAYSLRRPKIGPGSATEEI
jgi:alkanesulfonate monooxygenase SsuD/methylene tetrahydromethanopterin reductase-like flavin-dependent oxidoreductase (luciferase family)